MTTGQNARSDPAVFEAVVGRVRRRTPWREATRAILTSNYDEAAQIFARIGARPQEADARRRAAERLLGEGKSDEAAQQTHMALDFYRSVNAARYIRETAELLAETG